METLYLVCPVYLDVQSFIQLRKDSLQVLRESGFSQRAKIRFVIIDDTGGRDPEMSSLKFLADTTILEPPFNLGHQNAIVYAIRSLAPEIHSRDWVVTLDSDGEDQPCDLPRLLAPLLKTPDEFHRIILARRTKRKETFPFKCLYFGFKIFFKSLTGTVIKTGNFAAYRGWVAKNALIHPHFDLCYSASLLRLDLPREFIPCERGTRYAGRSRMNYAKLFNHATRMLTPFLDRIIVRALVLLSGFLGLGILLSVGAAIKAWVNDQTVPAWVIYLLLGGIFSFLTTLGNLIALFTVFSQSQSVTLARLGRMDSGTPSLPSTHRGAS